ncbi:hypothetical protein BKP45_19050 [Anaerobacillus alkalidiazotrophicus]|uniref:Exosporium leader peptide n=1 Tax=Anaerobacillus alkalidiazotrophicus TaxID=472963 RepID=A0A1S2M1E7_9BACI|nr:hypothetical protein [Anaerobacillus alkalidiazotrophicus]OIJ18542.1 hypothetical protein BKP45_19050 [Anaerobacillus alkalidiazotrophicus]
MPIQFLDMRVSQHSDNDADTTPIPVAPASLLFGDIGLQTAGVLPENVGDIRVNLNGYVKVSGLALLEELTIRVFRNGDEIFTTTFDLPALLGAVIDNTWGFSAVDYQPPAPLTGEIRYTATIESTGILGLTTAVIGAANFSGIAAAGTTTG